MKNLSLSDKRYLANKLKQKTKENIKISYKQG